MAQAGGSAAPNGRREEKDYPLSSELFSSLTSCFFLIPSWFSLIT